MHTQAESAQEELSGQLRRALGRLQGSDEQLLAAQQSLAFVAAEKKGLSQHCSELEQRLATMQQVIRHAKGNAAFVCSKSSMSELGGG